MTNSTMKNRMMALAVGAPLLSVGFVGLGAAPAMSSTSAEEVNVLGTVVATAEANVYTEPSASSSVIDQLPADTEVAVAEWATDDNPWVAVYVDTDGTVGYVQADLISVVERVDGSENAEETPDLDDSDDNSVDSGDSGVVDEEWSNEDGIDLELEDDFVVEDDGSDDWSGSDDNGPGREGGWDDFTEVDENEGEPTEIESGFIPGDNSSAAGLAGMAIGALLIGGGAYALSRREKLAENNSHNS